LKLSAKETQVIPLPTGYFDVRKSKKILTSWISVTEVIVRRMGVCVYDDASLSLGHLEADGCMCV